jgi:hypothetical protein
MGHGELQIRFAHGLKASLAASRPFPRLDECQPERAEPFTGDPGDQRLLVGEVPVERRAGDAERFTGRPQGQPFHSLFVDGAQGPIAPAPIPLAHPTAGQV